MMVMKGETEITNSAEGGLVWKGHKLVYLFDEAASRPPAVLLLANKLWGGLGAPIEGSTRQQALFFCGHSQPCVG